MHCKEWDKNAVTGAASIMLLELVETAKRKSRPQ